MPLNVIDTLKPKNGLDFPIVEAIDVFVDGYSSLADAVTHFATDAMISAINAVLSGKANTTDVNTAVANLQGQIDQIVISSSAESVVAPEVAAARVGADGTTYSTLKSRIDSSDIRLTDDLANLKSNIYNTDNLLINAKIVKNKYYVNGAAITNTAYSYAVIPMLSSKTYVLSRARYISYPTGAPAAESTNDNYEFTPEADGDVYITFYNDPQLEWKIYEKGKDATLIGTYQHPVLSSDILAQASGTDKKKVMSQKATTDAIADSAATLATEIEAVGNKNIDIKKISEVSIKDGTDLTPLATETGTGYYYVLNDEIKYAESDNYRYFKLPIVGGTTYKLDERKAYAITTDENGDIVDYYTDARTNIETSASAVLLWVSYIIDYGSTRKIAKNVILDTVQDTVYLFNNNIEEANAEAVAKQTEKAFELRNNTNIFDNCDFVENKYYANGFFANESYSVFVLHAKANTQYKFGCTMRFFYSIDSTDAIATNTSVGYTYTPQSDTILYCTVNNSDSNVWKAVAGTDDINAAPDIGVTALSPTMVAQGTGTSKTLLMSQKAITDAINSATNNSLTNKIYGKGFAKVTGDLSTGDSFTVPRTNLQKNNVYSFAAKITSFDTLLIGHAKNAYSGSWAEITNTKLIIHTYFAEDTTVEYTHGLTLSTYINIQIIVKDNNKADIIIYSSGTVFTQNNVNWYGNGAGDTFVESSGSTLNDCVFTWSSADFRKSTWIFGDSYLGLSNSARWASYLVDSGYVKNVLINAYAGEGTNASITALNNMIEYYGVPNTIVWCLGMNDGSDTNSTPSSIWANGISSLIDICESNNINLILATIPTVPNINHEAKNNYVRLSGYRYIDFANAVGADGTGAWYTGMLSGDNVHPSETGAKALYYRAIADCPEITYSNP